MNFYIMLDSDDGSSKELELKYCCICCKCPKCSNPIAQPAVFVVNTRLQLECNIAEIVMTRFWSVVMQYY